MSTITAADLKLGGRLIAACDAMGAGKLRTAAGIFMEISGDLNMEAETKDGLLAPDEDDWSAPLPAKATPVRVVQAADLQMCARNVHAYSAPEPTTGWRTCSICGSVNVAPPGDGPIDMSVLR